MICHCYCPNCGRLMAQAMHCQGDHVESFYIVTEYYSCRCGNNWKKETSFKDSEEQKVSVFSLTDEEALKEIDVLISPMSQVVFKEVCK